MPERLIAAAEIPVLILPRHRRRASDLQSRNIENVALAIKISTVGLHHDRGLGIGDCRRQQRCVTEISIDLAR